jgi:hypothetical protein
MTSEDESRYDSFDGTKSKSGFKIEKYFSWAILNES